MKGAFVGKKELWHSEMFVFEKYDWNSIMPYGNIYIYIYV